MSLGEASDTDSMAFIRSRAGADVELADIVSINVGYFSEHWLPGSRYVVLDVEQVC